MSGVIIVDVCNGTGRELDDLIRASRDYWESKRYRLISDGTGDDILFAYNGSIRQGRYTQGPEQMVSNGSVILVYERTT